MLYDTMPRALGRLVVLLFALSSILSTASAESIRIVSWNLEWFPGNRPGAPATEAKAQMEKAQVALKTLKPDVLLLQEIKDWAAAQELCSAIPGLQVHVVSQFDQRPQNQVIASKLPADSGWYAPWKGGEVDPPRGYSFAALQLPGDKFLLTYSLHLKSNNGALSRNIALRHESSRQLLAHIQEMLAIYSKRGSCAVVVGGDFNTSLDDQRFKGDFTLPALRAAGMHWTFSSVPFAKRITIPAEDEFPDNTFDHILTTGLGAPAASVSSFPTVSDHNPVVLEVDLEKADLTPKLNAEIGLHLLRSGASEAEVAVTISANAHDEIKAAEGRTTAVRGKVSEVGATRTGSIHFINFQGNRRNQFVSIVRKENLGPLLKALGIAALKELQGKEIEVRGEITLHRGTPQIEVAKGEQLKVFP